MSESRPPSSMSAYERRRWDELTDYWAKKSQPRQILPARVRDTWDSAREHATEATGRAAQAIADGVPQRAKDAAVTAAGAAVAPTLEAAVRTLELVNDWVLELVDPEPVLAYHRDHGHPVHQLTDLHDIDLEDLDRYTRRHVLQWRLVGAAEGAGLGALAMIPVPGVGSAAAIGLDMVAMQVLTAAIATRVCHCYGIDVQDPQMRPVVERMVARAYRDQLAKATTVNHAGAAMRASAGRVRWSNALRENHRILAAVEQLMKRATGATHVPVQNARMGLPVVATIAGAGTNQHVLAATAHQALQYAATLHLARRYGLELPPSLTDDETTDPADG